METPDISRPSVHSFVGRPADSKKVFAGVSGSKKEKRRAGWPAGRSGAGRRPKVIIVGFAKGPGPKGENLEVSIS